MVLEKILESPLDCKEIKPVNPKGNHPEYSLEGLMLKLQSFRYLMWTAWLEKTLTLAKIKGKRRGGDRGWDGWIASLTQWTWELDHKEDWAPKNWWFQTVVLKNILESPLDSKEIKPVNPKGNHPWIFIGRTDAGAEVPILWPPDVKSWLIGKDPGARKDGRQEVKKTTEDEIVR